MSLEDKERLEKEMREKALNALQDQDEVVRLISFNLKNFSYRYLESETTGEGMPLLQGENQVLIELKEPKLSQALKTQNAETRKGLIELAKSFSKKDQPEVCFRLGVEMENTNSQGGGDYMAFAEVNWDFPIFNGDTSKKNRKTFKRRYEDGLELRNDLAKILEEVCDIF